MNKLSVDQVELKGKRVFIRVDFNVPLEKGWVTDVTRIDAALPTIEYAVKEGARVIVASHLGRPKGKVSPEFSLRQVAPAFSERLGRKVNFVEDCVGDKVKKAVNSLGDGDVLLLENLRFHPEEEKNGEEFARALASLCDVYVNDAFGTAHRAHASTAGITQFVDQSAAGYLLKAEIEYFNRSLSNPERPLAVVIGGAKVSTKLTVLNHLIDKCDIMVIGGAMAFTFLKAMGMEIGGNILEEEMIDNVNGVMEKAKKKGVKLYLPVDFIVAESIDSHEVTDVVTSQELPKGLVAPDIGPASAELFVLALKPARTIIWNGPMGVFENPHFATGTLAVAKAMAKSTALTIIGGGDSVKAVNKAGLSGKMSHISTGGGAFLELLEGKTLPGLSALTDG